MDQAQSGSNTYLAASTSESIRQFSLGLWRIFIGMLMLNIGAFTPILLLQMQIPVDSPFVWLFPLAAIVGLWTFLSGKQHCWAFALPVQKRHYLTLSFAFDVAAFICRLLRNLEAVGPIAKGLTSLFALLSLCFLIAFIGYLAKVIGAKASQWLVWGNWVAMIFTMVASFSWGLLGGLRRPDLAFAPMSLAIVFAATFVALFLALTLAMSIQLKQLSEFLERET